MRFIVCLCVYVLGKLTKIVFIGAANATHSINIIQLCLQAKREWEAERKRDTERVRESSGLELGHRLLAPHSGLEDRSNWNLINNFRYMLVDGFQWNFKLKLNIPKYTFSSISSWFGCRNRIRNKFLSVYCQILLTLEGHRYLSILQGDFSSIL